MHTLKVKNNNTAYFLKVDMMLRFPRFVGCEGDSLKLTHPSPWALSNPKFDWNSDMAPSNTRGSQTAEDFGKLHCQKYPVFALRNVALNLLVLQKM